MDRAAFYSAIRPTLGALTQAQVDGFERYLAEGTRRRTPLDRLAYILATVFWETARTMQPVKEAFWKSEAWRRSNLRYFPWYGRGDVQLTWEANYRKAGRAIGVDLIANPDLALDPKNAVRITFEGMEQGWFTGRDLGDYLDGKDEDDKEDLREFANARRIVNGTDKAIEIARLALMFEKALRKAGYSVPAVSEIVEPAPALVVSHETPIRDTQPALPVTGDTHLPAPIGHNGGPPLVVPEPVAKPNLSPLEQMNKPVQGAKAGLGASTFGGAVVLLLASAGWLPSAWSSGEAAIALGLVSGTLSTVIGGFVGGYLARDKRFQEARL